MANLLTLFRAAPQPAHRAVPKFGDIMPVEMQTVLLQLLRIDHRYVHPVGQHSLDGRDELLLSFSRI